MTDDQRRLTALNAMLDDIVDTMMQRVEEDEESPQDFGEELIWPATCLVDVINYYKSRGTQGADLARPMRRRLVDA